jgi:hypothetical protein
MTLLILRMLKLKKVRVALMCVLAFGEINSVTSKSSSKDPLSSQIMVMIWLSFLISFFVWDKTKKSFTFASKIKIA